MHEGVDVGEGVRLQLDRILVQEGKQRSCRVVSSVSLRYRSSERQH